MASWHQVEREAPELAARARAHVEPQAQDARHPAPRWLAAHQRHRAHLRRGRAVARRHVTRPSRRSTFGAILALPSTAPPTAPTSGRRQARGNGRGGHLRRAQAGHRPGQRSARSAAPLPGRRRRLVVISLGGDPPDHIVLESWHRRVRRSVRRAPTSAQRSLRSRGTRPASAPRSWPGPPRARCRAPASPSGRARGARARRSSRRPARSAPHALQPVADRVAVGEQRSAVPATLPSASRKVSTVRTSSVSYCSS